MAHVDPPVVRSVHRVALKYRWMTVLLAPPLSALMAWAWFESIHNNLGDDGEIQLWVILLSSLIFGGMALVIVCAVVWAFRARVVIDGERMTVRGAFLTTVVTPERMTGFRYLNGQLHVYLADRRWAMQIAFFEDLWVICRWVQERTHDLAAEMLKEEDAAIAGDQSLGLSDADKEARLASLRNVTRRVNYLVYLTAAVAFVNFLFIEHAGAELIAMGVLMLTPVFLDLLALSNRGHVRIDYEEGSRYPQIFTGTMTAGVVLAMLSLLDRGALLGGAFYDLLLVFVLAKGLLWCFIDRDRLQVLAARGKAITVITVVAMFAVPAFWVGGSLYQLNKLLDGSATSWHATEIVDKRVSSGKITRYTVELAPWDPEREAPVEYALRRAEFDGLEVGMRVRVGVREGAIGIRRASELQPVIGPFGDGVRSAAEPAKLSAADNPP
jgi:hypothetical protein